MSVMGGLYILIPKSPIHAYISTLDKSSSQQPIKELAVPLLDLSCTKTANILGIRSLSDGNYKLNF